jgi:hypothetical protein
VDDAEDDGRDGAQFVEQPSLSSFSISAGNALSDELVPSTKRSSSFR